MKFFWGFVLTIFIHPAFGQHEKPDTTWFPDMPNRMPIRFFLVKSKANLGYNINSKSELDEIGKGQANIDANKHLGIELRFPIVYKKNAMFTGGLKFYDEQYYFHDIAPDDHPLFVSLDDRNLRKLGGSINGFIHLNRNRSLILRTTFYLAGDFFRDEDQIPFGDLMKGSIAIGYGIKRDPNTFFAFGVYGGYKFGDPSIYPAVIISKQFRNNIGMDAMLPQSIKAWKKVSDSFFVYGESRVTGNSYAIKVNSTVLNETESLQLRQSAITSSIGIFKKLGTWVWLEAAVGYTYNLSFKLTESSFEPNSTLFRSNTDYLIDSNVTGSPYVSLSLSLALPEGFIDKMLEKKTSK